MRTAVCALCPLAPLCPIPVVACTSDLVPELEDADKAPVPVIDITNDSEEDVPCAELVLAGDVAHLS